MRLKWTEELSHRFWEKVYIDCESLYLNVNKMIADDKPSHAIQIWCADMWAVLWNLWFFDREVKVSPKLHFSWATSNIQDWTNNPIYHNAGVTGDNMKMFYKGGYINRLPFDIKIESFNPNLCSYKYAEEILKTKEVTCLI
jgi:hypothetical protein